MRGQVTIGEFSTMTRLTRKALRHYHDLGLLEPVVVDPVNGYRYYSAGQVETARLIRRLRELDLPVPDVKSYLAADDQARDDILAGHLARMQTQLRQTQDAVSALQSLLAARARCPDRDHSSGRARWPSRSLPPSPWPTSSTGGRRPAASSTRS